MGKIAFVFSGQGAQYPGMGGTLTEYSTAAAEAFSTADKLRPGTSTQCFSGTAEELMISANTQPCVFTVSLAAAEALREKGISPDAVAGFSLGEVTALTFSGAFTHESGFLLVCRRAALMQEAAEKNPGKMAAVMKLDAETVSSICDEIGGVWPVNYNCPGQIAVAGAAEKMEAFTAAVKSAGGRAALLAVGGGFHSPFMEQASRALLPEIITSAPSSPRIPVYANATAQPYTKEALPELLSKQVKSPVLWQQSIENMAKDGVYTFIEVGPGKVLSGLIKRILPEARIYSCDSADQARQIVAEMQV